MIAPGINKNMIRISQFPVPQSCNHIWEPTTRYINGRPRASIRLSDEARNYEEKEVFSYSLRNGILLAQAKLVLREWLRQENFIRIDLFIVIPGTKIWTLKGDKRAFDHFNFTKLIHDGLAKLTDCDDKFYFSGYQELVEGPLNAAFCDAIFTPHKPRSYKEINQQVSMAPIN